MVLQSPGLAGLAGLVEFVVLVALSTSVACAVAARLGGRSVRGTATAFAPSLVPIAAGYVVAHYWCTVGGLVLLFSA